MKTIDQLLAEETMIFENIRIENMTAKEALKRLERVKTKIQIASEISDKKGYLKHIAGYALIGEIDDDFFDNQENKQHLEIDNVDLEQIDEEEMKDRITWLSKKIENMLEPKDFIVIARYALTGIPF